MSHSGNHLTLVDGQYKSFIIVDLQIFFNDVGQFFSDARQLPMTHLLVEIFAQRRTFHNVGLSKESYYTCKYTLS